MTYRLVNVELQYKQSPKTSFLPHSQDRQNLVQGDLVRLSLQAEGGGESEGVWVSVKTAFKDRYIGQLVEAPQSVPGLEVGMEINFAAENISHIWADQGDSRFVDPGLLALVSRQMYDEDSWPGRLNRFRPRSSEHSGWIIMSGNEPRGYESNPANFFPMRLGELIKRFPPLASILARPVGDIYRWNDDLCEYKQIVPL